MAMNEDHLLECGTDPDELWDTIDQPPTPHQRQCPYCTETRASLRPLADLTQEYRRHEADSADRQPDPGLSERIMGVVRTEARQGRPLPLDQPRPDRSAPTDPGRRDAHLTVAEYAAATVARRAAETVRGVQVRRCRIALAEPDDDPTTPGVEPTSRPATVSVTLRISMAATASVPGLAPAVRAAVSRAVRQEVGIDVVRTDIAVEDLHDA